jgi:hypothetical protein
MSILKIGQLTTKPSKLDQTTNPYWSFSGSLDTNIYTDITSNKNWMGVGQKHYDYLFCRNQVMMRTAVIGFSALTTEEKEIAAEHFAVGDTERSEVFTTQEQQTNWNEFILNAEKTRNKRWREAKGYISYNLPFIDSIDLGKKTNELSNEYIIYGIEDKDSDGVAGLFDWLENKHEYSGGTGFSGQTYWTQEHQDKIMSILRDGIY